MTANKDNQLIVFNSVAEQGPFLLGSKSKILLFYTVD